MRLSIKKGKGVLGKDGTPWAPGTMHVVNGKWMSATRYDPASLLEALLDEKTDKVEVISEFNTLYEVEIDRS